MPSPDEVVGCGLGSRIRAARAIRSSLGEWRIILLEVAIYLIGGDVMETEASALLPAELAPIA
jgi:hypothetical protein